MKAGAVVLGVAILGVARSASAYRPFDATDADVAAEGELELELGPVGYLQSGREHSVFAPSGVVNLGIAPRFELVAEGQEFYLLDAGRTSSRERIDAAMSLKAVLRRGSLQDRSGPSMAVEAGPLLPSWQGDPQGGFEGTLIVSQRWSAATLHVDLAGARTRAGNGEGIASVILEGPYRWSVRPVFEGFYDRELGASRTWSALFGTIGRLDDDVSLDAALRWARVDATNALELRAGLTWALRLWGKP